MPQPQGPYKTKPTPQVDALRAMQQVFTDDQIMRIAALCQERIEHGWGEVVIRFDNHRPDVICVTVSEKLPRGER